MVDIDTLPDPMHPGAVAALFKVDPKTVMRWANQRRVRSFRTAGGHRRFRKADVLALFNREVFVSAREHMYRRRVGALHALVGCMESGKEPWPRLLTELKATGRYIGVDGSWLADDTPDPSIVDTGDVYPDIPSQPLSSDADGDLSRFALQP